MLRKFASIAALAFLATALLKADAEAIEQSLNQAPLDVPDVHPNVAQLYRRKVERLTEALNDPDDRTQAATALRGLIDKIVLTPGARRGEISAQLFGDLETVLAWAHDQGDRRREVACSFPWAVEGALSVAVGAGPGMTVEMVVRPKPSPPASRAAARPRRPE